MPLKRIEPGRIDRTLTTTVSREYKDIDLSLTSKKGTMFEDGKRRGDIYKRFDLRAIDQSIQNILLTAKGEKPFDPDFGSNLRRLLFELNTSVTASMVENEIKSALRIYEPRVKVRDVKLYDNGAAREVPKGIDNIFFYSTGGGDDRYSLTVTVVCEIKNTGQVVQAQVNMNRLR
jgi:phage baseplate assembly protein W